MKVYLTRHGETDWNKSHRTQGRTDLALNDNGRAQAACLAGRLQSKNISYVYSSPLQRARDTAQIVCDACGAVLLEDERLTERDFGPLEGMTFPELLKKYPKEMNTWFHDPYAHEQPGVEPVPAILDRLVSFFREMRLQRSKEENILIVTHGTVAGLLLLQLMDLPIRQLHHMGMANCAYTEITLDMMAYPFLSTLNDTSHLEALK